MEKFRSLADFLGNPEGGTSAPAELVQAEAPRLAESAQDLEAFSLEKLTGQEFADALLNSVIFRRYIVNGMTMGTIPVGVVVRLMDYGTDWGKPVERLEVQNTHSLDTLSSTELRAHLCDRVASLQTMLQLLDDEPSGVH